MKFYSLMSLSNLLKTSFIGLLFIANFIGARNSDEFTSDSLARKESTKHSASNDSNIIDSSINAIDSNNVDNLQASFIDSNIKNIDSLTTSENLARTDSLIIRDSITTDNNNIDLTKDSLVVDTTNIDTNINQLTYEINMDTTRFSLFLSLGGQFTNFKNRSLFIDDHNHKYNVLYNQAINSEERSYISTQRQKYGYANLAIPFGVGVSWQFYQNHYLKANLSYSHNKENAILTDREGKIYYQYYAIQIVPAYLEYQVLIPENIAKISEQLDLSLSFRWFWLLPGTEIYTNNGSIDNEFNPKGNGMGFYLGYVLKRFKHFSLSGNLGYSVVKATSKHYWTDVLPATTNNEKAKWNVGGLAINFHFNFHFAHYSLPERYIPEKYKNKSNEQTPSDTNQKNILEETNQNDIKID